MTKDCIEVSLVISVYGQLEHTKRCLLEIDKTLKGEISYEVLIVDDASKDGTPKFLRSLDSRYRIFYNETNKGFAKNNNFAAKQAHGKYLCFLNNDVFVQGNWLLPMLEVFKTYEKVGMVGNVQQLTNSRRYDHMGVVFTPQGNPRHYGQGFFHRPFKGKVKQWSAVTAACCITVKENFLAIGGFDEVFVNGCEDVDLCLRMTEKGLDNYVVHDSLVFHVKGASEGRKTFNDKNTQILLDRWQGLIISNQSVSDQYRHAWTYFYRGIVKPWSINVSKWIEAILILLRLKKLPSIKS